MILNSEMNHKSKTMLGAEIIRNPMLETMPINGKNVHEILDIELFLDSNLNFTIRVFN